MKKLISLIVTICASIIVIANQRGHFFLNVENENVQVTNVESKLSEWLDLPTNTTFIQFRDEIDNLGIRHLSYKCYVNSVEVNDAVILVHARNNVVSTVNGDFMEATATPQHPAKCLSPLKATQKVKKNAKETDTELKIIRITINGEEVYRYAYEIFAEDYTFKSYVDAETGEIIKTVPLVYNADVAGTATTMYYGTQAITCYEDNGKFYLKDTKRGIITLDATNNPYKIDYSKTQQATTLEEYKNLLTPEIENLIASCSYINNSSANWNSTWQLQLKKVVIENVLESNTWYSSIGENNADVFIKIKNNIGEVLYQSGYYEDPTFPITFNLPAPIEMSNLPYYIEIWDYDPIDDDLIETITISTVLGENFNYPLGKIACGIYTVESNGKRPAFDAHWGMEKTYDFFKEKFNRSSYDNEGSIIYNLVNQPSDNGELKEFFRNAAALKCFPYPMVYGMGLLSTTAEFYYQSMAPIVAIDIMAHEFTHLVTELNGNGGLNYIGESGALNESFSDIIGISVKKYATGNNNWLIGDEVMINVSNMRSLAKPNSSNDGIFNMLSSPQPDTYHGIYWKDTEQTNCETCDHGGVHTNSGVQNFWFYLLSEGGNGTNDNEDIYYVKGIGIDKAVQIAYRNLIYYLTPEATFEDARNGSIQAAIDLYGKGSKEHQSVVNAWFAVGVGETYVTDGDITISAKMPDNWGNTISAWVWENGKNGQWATLENDGEWYTYTTTANPVNIIFVNGNTWNGDNNQTVDITLYNSACLSIGDEQTGKRSFTYVDCDEEIAVKAKMPNDWGNTISAWVWQDGSEGQWATLEKDGDWYLYTTTEGPFKIIFVNGTTWKGDNNQSVDISITENTCIQLSTNSGKRSYTKTDCEPENEATAIESTSSIPSQNATKILRNGQLFILRDGKTYTVQGQEVR